MYKSGIPAEYLARQSPRDTAIYDMQTEDRQTQSSQADAISLLEQELAAERERYLRLAADFENFRKRIAREMEQRAAVQKEAVVRDLLPCIDNLERSLSAKPGEDLRKGVGMVYRQMLDVLKNHGFEPRDDLGQEFDGRFHHALAVGSKQELPELCILEVWERGWMRNGELFRPAKVLVNKTSEDRQDAGRAVELANN